jgi:hypothetical protein
VTVSKQVIQFGVLSADDVAIGFVGTGAERTRAIVTRALEALEANGVISIVPDEKLPPYYVPFPPYEPIKLEK